MTKSMNPIKASFYRTNTWLIGLSAWLLMAVIGWAADDYLTKSMQRNRFSNAWLVRELSGRQQQPLTVFRQVGTEEKQRNLRERPIIEPIQQPEPFRRGTDYFILVERYRNLEINLKLEQLKLSPELGLQLMPATKVFAYYSPEWDIEYPLQSVEGQYHLTFAPGKLPVKIRLQIREGAERHNIDITLWNQKKPVTYRNFSRPKE